jgi:hypothetical protein
MMAFAGIQYQNLPQRLCNAYRLDDQTDTGMALVIASVVIAAFWCWRTAPGPPPCLNPNQPPCGIPTMKAMPDNVVHYRSDPEFTEATVPAALQRGHNTAAGVWGRITILEGSLCYKITDPSVPAEQLLLTPERRHRRAGHRT